MSELMACDCTQTNERSIQHTSRELSTHHQRHRGRVRCSREARRRAANAKKITSCQTANNKQHATRTRRLRLLSLLRRWSWSERRSTPAVANLANHNDHRLYESDNRQQPPTTTVTTDLERLGESVRLRATRLLECA